MVVHSALMYEPSGCSTRLHQSAASVSFNKPLQHLDAVVSCSRRLQSSAAKLDRGALPRRFTAALHRGALPRRFTAALHRGASPRRFTAALYRGTLPRRTESCYSCLERFNQVVAGTCYSLSVVHTVYSILYFSGCILFARSR